MAPVADRGLIIGKFLPPTAGHAHLIAAAQRRVRELVVLVCSLGREAIPGAARARWVAEMAPRARVVHLAEELPSFPEDDPDFWRLWRTAIRRAVPEPIDLVFSSEDYGDRLAAELGARHVMVDRERSAVPVSGTRVRADPLACWDLIAEPARPWFLRRIVVLGPESTGKTTLARDLAKHYRTAWVPEFAREFVDRLGGLDALAPGHIDAIAAGQVAAETVAARRANRLLFCDTDVITTTIYAHHYFGTCPAAVQRLADEHRHDYYLLADIDLPWQADPQRDQPHRRPELFARFRDQLTTRRLPFALVAGTGADRLGSATAAVDRFVAETGTAWKPKPG